MANGSSEAITYEEVKAYQANQGIAVYGNSGGYVTGGIWINWDQTGGFSGTGWKSEDKTSPAYGMSQEDINGMIQDSPDGSLNEMFRKWVQNVDYEIRYTWIFANIPESCRYEVIGG